MQNLKILNKKEVKNIFSIIKKQFDADVKLNYVFLINNKNRLYIVNKEVFDINIDKLKINSFGLYFGEFRGDGLRLSIEGSQLIGPKAKKNVLELDNKQAREWLKGYDSSLKSKEKGFVIIKHKNDFLGCGKVVENKILNYVPKTRRLRVSD
jgi:NOL1/NOP2/fmu family ribosome biogenesis protein